MSTPSRRTVYNAVSLAIHCTNFATVLLSLRGEVLKDQKVYDMHTQQFIYFTVWNLIFQALYLGVNILCDVQEYLKINDMGILKPIKAYQQIFFDGLVCPCTMMVIIIFWPLFLYDRELVYPEFIDAAIGAVPNYIMHAFIFLPMFWEWRCDARTKPRSVKWSAISFAVLFFAYFYLVINNYLTRGLWPYPFMYKIYGTIYFPMMILASGLLAIFCFHAQWPMRRFSCNITFKNKRV